MTSDNPFIIDENRLDRELIDLPGQTRDAGVREAEARHQVAQAKARLEVTQARILLDVRKHPNKYDLRDKPNEAEVEAAVTVSGDYTRDLKAYNDCKYELDLAEADTNAFLTKRKSVEALVDILRLNYFAEREPSSVDPEARDKMEEMRRKALRSDQE